MKDFKITCPHCGSEQVEYIDEMRTKIDVEGGYGHYSFSCNNMDCEEYFYVFMEVETTKIEVSRDKYKNYKTIFKK